MVVGHLVREDCSSSEEAHARIGTIVKVTRYELSKDSSYSQIIASGTAMPDQYSTIRPGHIISVRWQHDPTKLTVHVFYDGIEGSVINIMGNTNTIFYPLEGAGNENR